MATQSNSAAERDQPNNDCRSDVGIVDLRQICSAVPSGTREMEHRVDGNQPNNGAFGSDPDVRTGVRDRDPAARSANRFLVELERMSVRRQIRGDLRHEIGDLSAFIGDETEVNALWPASESVTLRGRAELAKLNAAASVFGADLHVASAAGP